MYFSLRSCIKKYIPKSQEKNVDAVEKKKNENLF